MYAHVDVKKIFSYLTYNVQFFVAAVAVIIAKTSILGLSYLIWTATVINGFFVFSNLIDAPKSI